MAGWWAVSVDALVSYHIQNADGQFMCDDKHANRTWFGRFDDPFCCRWWNPTEPTRWMKSSDRLRVAKNGRLL